MVGRSQGLGRARVAGPSSMVLATLRNFATFEHYTGAKQWCFGERAIIERKQGVVGGGSSGQHRDQETLGQDLSPRSYTSSDQVEVWQAWFSRWRGASSTAWMQLALTVIPGPAENGVSSAGDGC